MAVDVEVLDDVHEEVLGDDTEQAPNEGLDEAIMKIIGCMMMKTVSKNCKPCTVMAGL